MSPVWAQWMNEEWWIPACAIVVVKPSMIFNEGHISNFLFLRGNSNGIAKAISIQQCTIVKSCQMVPPTPLLTLLQWCKTKQPNKPNKWRGKKQIGRKNTEMTIIWKFTYSFIICQSDFHVDPSQAVNSLHTLNLCA